MGGDLTVQSAGPGRGAVFILELPLAQAPDPYQRAADG
jgi:signal transduction histidine kinase